MDLEVTFQYSARRTKEITQCAIDEVTAISPETLKR